MSTLTSPPDTSRRAVIFGGRSWIGYQLATQLQRLGWSVLCTTTSVQTVLPHPQNDQWNQPELCPVEYVTLQSSDEASQLLLREQPSVVINLLIGTTEVDFNLNQTIASLSEQVGAYYVYASSALALDGYENEPLVESLPPRSVSEYGVFKGRCEQDLENRSGLAALILRFSSIHGWSPWKDTRTVVLLKKAARGERITVNQGVMQNRCTDIRLTESIVALIQKRATGVAHLGTSDCSEEYVFLNRLANAFGFDGENIVLDQPRAINLTVIPDLGVHPNGAILEADTISELRLSSDLAPYKNMM